MAGYGARQTGQKTYISSLLTEEDRAATGLFRNESGPLFVGNIGVLDGIVFPDGTTQTSAGVALPSVIDAGTF